MGRSIALAPTIGARRPATSLMGARRGSERVGSCTVSYAIAVMPESIRAFVSSGITRPVRRLLDGTRAVEAGRLDGSIVITTQDEIGQLTAAFNVTRALLPVLREAGGGQLIYISSVSAKRPESASGAAYIASKAGMNGLAAAVNEEERKNGIA